MAYILDCLQSQIDNLDLVGQKWKAIVTKLDKHTKAAGLATGGVPAEDTGASPGGGQAEGEQDGSGAAPLQPASAQRYMTRLSEARVKLPAFLKEEADFWADKGPSAKSAPFAPGHNHGGFMVSPSKREPDALTPQARWALSALDNTGHDVPDGLEINPTIKKAFDDLWYAELDSASAHNGCKKARDDSVLTLHSSAGKPPPSRLAFNPDKDVCEGDCAVVKMDRVDTPGGRGWDFVEVSRLDPANEEHGVSTT